MLKRERAKLTSFARKSGSYLLSHAVTHAVSSTPRSLTSVFGMGTGVSSAIWPPENHNPRGVVRIRQILWLSRSVISTSQLNALLHLHLSPINVVVFYQPDWEVLSSDWLRTYMLSALIHTQLGYPAVLLAQQQVHQRLVQPGPLVLGSASVKLPTPTPDRDRTVSRRSKPSSRTALIGEQPNPWDLLQPQDAMSRHRGAKPPRRCGLLAAISLLSPAYLLSFERRPSHSEPPDH